jgi:neutral ceramidase
VKIIHSQSCVVPSDLKLINYLLMKKLLIFAAVSFIFIIPFNYAGANGNLQDKTTGWKAGVARVLITPEQSMWMAGYGSRKHPSEGTLVDLWAKALAFEDADGKQAVLVTTDILGFPKNMSDNIKNRIKEKFGLSKAQIILNSSHTHSGPVLRNSLYNFYPLDAPQLAKIEQYSSKLEDQIVNLVGKALKSMVPVQIYAMNGVTRFQVNRRNNVEAKLLTQTELRGPNDYAVPVIKVVNAKGNLIAIAFGYACHNTVLDIYKWSGDYAGYAQKEVEKLHPGVTALFCEGAGADQNPLPRRTIPLAQQYGQELAVAVERVLAEDMRKLPSTLSTSYSEVTLPYASPPTIEELTKISNESNDSQKKWARNLLEKLGNDKSLLTAYPYYPCQVWKLGDQPIMVMGGELTIAYSIELKKVFGPNIFVFGYSNDLMSYIPSATIIREGGYEGASSQRGYGMPGIWSESIETIILQEMTKLAEQNGIPRTTVK